MFKRASLLLVAGVVAAGSCNRSAGQRGEQAEAKPRPRPKFTVSKETTYVDGPLDKDGYIDYAAALNERLRKGVTPENNGCVLICKALGPRPEGKRLPAEFYEWLDIEEPAIDGQYFKAQLFSSEVEASMPAVSDRPWTSEDHPEYAAALKANEKPLALVLEATKRPKYFHPLVSRRTAKGPSGLLNALLPIAPAYQSLARALTARAMLHLGEKRPAEAWEDLLTCHRLSRMVGRGGTLIESMVAYKINEACLHADLAFLAETEFTSKQLGECLRSLIQVPSHIDNADKIDGLERFVALDTLMLINRYGSKYLSNGALAAPDPLEQAVLNSLDWDPGLMRVNKWYNRCATTLREKDRSRRVVALKALEADGAKLRDAFGDRKNMARAILDPQRRDTVAAAFGDLVSWLFASGCSNIQRAADRAEQQNRHLHLAFALAIYKRQNGHSPKTLAMLAPDFLPSVPDDLFSGKPLIYRPTKDGYLLYSVGVNGKDDEGRTAADDPPGDDLAIRMPLPKPREK